MVSHVSWLVKNFNTGIFSDAINVISVKVCMMALLIELCRPVPLSVTVTIFQGLSSVKHFQLQNVIFLSNKVETLWDCYVHQIDREYTNIFYIHTYSRGIIDTFSDLTKTLILAFLQMLLK